MVFSLAPGHISQIDSGLEDAILKSPMWDLSFLIPQGLE